MAFKLNEGKTEVKILKANVGMTLDRNYPVFRCDFLLQCTSGTAMLVSTGNPEREQTSLPLLASVHCGIDSEV